MTHWQNLCNINDMDSPEGDRCVGEAPVKKHNPVLRLLSVLGIFAGTAAGGAACGNTPSEQQGVQYGQGMANRDAASATATATSKQAEEVRKQVNQTLGQDKPFAER